MTKPIKPDEVVSAKTKTIPDEVFAAFNELIAQRWNGSYSQFTQDEVIKGVLRRKPEITRAEMFEMHWLDIEDCYRDEGWHVEYDKPAYNETYAANFKFSKGRKKS